MSIIHFKIEINVVSGSSSTLVGFLFIVEHFLTASLINDIFVISDGCMGYLLTFVFKLYIYINILDGNMGYCTVLID